MGYETKLLVGKESLATENATCIKETYFFIYAMVDLCKCGYDSNISKLDFKSEDESHQWYWYEGDIKITEDCYGDKPKPLPISLVVDALKKDQENDPYRRFKWAIALLESMQDDDENLTVILYGH